MSATATHAPAERRRIDQFVPSFARHDAIGNHVIQLQGLLRGAGFESEIFYEFIDPRLGGVGRPFGECDPNGQPGRLILYHASTHSEMTGWLIEAAGRGQEVMVDYHNITPSPYFVRWEPQAARSMDLARLQLEALAPFVGRAVADSDYNGLEMEALGVPSVTCPIILDLDEYHREPDAALKTRLRAGGPLWVFVGRIAPNKCQHDVIASFAVYRRLYAPDARLALVGGVTSERYQRALRAMVETLGVHDAVDFVGSAPFPQLLAYFASADVFVCLSEHEGFCVPVIEAMELGLPVVAFSAAAVTETVANAGVLLENKDPLAVAAAVDSVVSSNGKREELVESGRLRAAQFSKDASSKRWLAEMRSGVPEHLG